MLQYNTPFIVGRRIYEGGFNKKRTILGGADTKHVTSQKNRRFAGKSIKNGREGREGKTWARTAERELRANEAEREGSMTWPSLDGGEGVEGGRGRPCRKGASLSELTLVRSGKE